MIDVLKKIAGIIFRKQTAIFLFFLLLSANFWLMHSIGSNREIPITYTVEYVNLPNNVKITNTLEKEINVSVAVFFAHHYERVVGIESYVEIAIVGICFRLLGIQLGR